MGKKAERMLSLGSDEVGSRIVRCGQEGVEKAWMVVSRLDSLIVMHQHFDHQLAGVVHLETRLSRNQSKPQAASPH